MSKCVLCGRELLTGDIHWEQGLCNECYGKIKYPGPYFDIVVDRRKLDIREKYIEKLKEENKVLKKALELICCYVEYDYDKKNDDIYYRNSKELELYFMEKARDFIGEEV